jgi:hypothetical protein
MAADKKPKQPEFKPYWKTGKAKIPLKVIRAAVRKVRDERLAREKAEATTRSPE